MAKKQCVLTSVFVLYVLALAPVTGWFFTPKGNIIARANGKPVDEKCVALGETGDCEFYRCFEARLSCKEKGYMLRFGLPYCQRFYRTLPAFTPQGQVFINSTSRCLTKALLPFYRQDQVDCHDLSHAAFDAVSSCYAANGFCRVVRNNTGAFIDVYKPKHLFQTGALKIWRELLEVTYQCDPDSVHQFANFIFRILGKIFGLFTSRR